MKITKQYLIGRLILILFWCSLILSAPAVQAGTLWDTAQQGGLQTIGQQAYGQGVGEPEDIRLVVARIIQIFIGLLGIIFLILIVLSGYRWMTAAGNEEQITKAQKTMTAAAIGLIIVLAAWGITLFVGAELRRAVTGELW